LLHKAVFWSLLATTIAFVVFVALIASGPGALVEGAPAFLLVIVGVLLNAFIATGIGVLGTNALETEPRRRIHVSMIYLYLLLAAMFGYALYVPSAWAKFAQIVLSALLAVAIWQKVRDHTPFLLDPSEEPAPNVAVADGVIAALTFFVLQGVLALSFHAVEFSPGASLLFAFTGAGLIAALGTLFIFWRSRVPDLLGSVGLRRPRGGVARSALYGIAGGLAAGLVARGYLVVVDRIEVLRRLRDETVSLSPADASSGLVPWFGVLALVAAPLFEEFIFRGVLYGGFRRSVGPAKAAVFSAAVFAIVHPAIATAPVFVLGVLAAVAFERSRSLLSSVIIHMTYNAVVIGVALVRVGKAIP
jgi:membrane protease YdiL (CAAX protease family)